MKDREQIRPIIVTLGKLLVFAAWADGEIQEEEYEVIKDQLFSLPDLNDEEWASVLIYMEYPMTENELQHLLRDFNRLIKTPEQREYAINAVAKVIASDGVVTEEEQEALNYMSRSIKEDTLLDKLIELLKKALFLARERRKKSAALTYNREKDLDDFQFNPVFFQLTRKAKELNQPLQFTKHELRKLCLAGALMARVVQADEIIHDDELALMLEELVEKWKMSEDAAWIVMSVALNKDYGDMDILRISRQFYEVSDRDERNQFFEVLGAIAYADDHLSTEELDALEDLGAHLKIHRNRVNYLLGLEERDSEAETG